jgi:hypothetical protein
MLEAVFSFQFSVRVLNFEFQVKTSAKVYYLATAEAKMPLFEWHRLPACGNSFQYPNS